MNQKKTTLTVATEFGTFTRTTARPYTHLVLVQNTEKGRFGSTLWTSRIDLARAECRKVQNGFYGPTLVNPVVIDLATGKRVL